MRRRSTDLTNQISDLQRETQQLRRKQPASGGGEPGLATHLANPTDAHDASAISVVPFSTIASTNVQAALQEIVAESTGGGTGAPTTAQYLVGIADGGLSAEIVVGTTPGGELGGTWATPTVDASHSGSTHAAVQAAAEATAATNLNAHLADTIDAHDASAISFVPTSTIGSTDVQAAIVEVMTEASSGGGAVPVGRQIVSGGGLVGGGDLSVDRTLAVGAGTGLIVNADDVAVNFGTTAGTVCQGNDSRLGTGGGGAPTGPAGGVLSGTYPNPGLAASIPGSGLSYSGAGNSLNVNPGDGISIIGDNVTAKAGIGLTTASAAIDCVFGSAALTVCQGNDSRLSDARPPNGAAGGALAGSYPNPTLATGVAVPTARQIVSGAGLSGGGSLANDLTLNVGAGTGIQVNADSVEVLYGTTAGTACQGNDARLSAATGNPGTAITANVVHSGFNEVQIVAYAVAANELHVGTSFRFAGAFVVSPAGGALTAAAPDVYLRVGTVSLGGSVMVSMNAIAATLGGTGFVDGLITVRTTGTSGQMTGSMHFSKDGQATRTAASTAMANMNTTVALIIELTAASNGATNQYTWTTGMIQKVIA